MARNTQLSKEKLECIITLRLEGQLIQEISTTLNVSYSTAIKTIKSYDELALMMTILGKEDQELPLHLSSRRG